LAIGLILCAGLLLLLAGRERERPESAVLLQLRPAADQAAARPNAAWPSAAAAGMPAYLRVPVRDSTHASVRNAQRFAPVLRQLQAERSTDDASLKTLHDEVRIACALVHQPDGTSARVDLDASRRPWLDALQQRCAGLPAEHLQPLPVDHPAQRAWRALIPANQASQAQALALSDALLDGSADAGLLHEALRFRLAHGQLPVAGIYAGLSPPVEVDLEAAFAPAAELIACAHAGSCASDSLWTLYTCAQLGCPAGSDLDQALRWLLPKAQYENARRLAAWVLAGAPE
jgi:hypothetical protein